MLIDSRKPHYKAGTKVLLVAAEININIAQKTGCRKLWICK